MNGSDELLIEVLEQVRQQGFSLPHPRSLEPLRATPRRTPGQRSRVARKELVCGYRVEVADDAAGSHGLPELRGHTVIVGPDLMGLPLEVVTGWCAIHLARIQGSTKGAMAAARKLRELSIRAVVDRCQTEPTSLPQASITLSPSGRWLLVPQR